MSCEDKEHDRWMAEHYKCESCGDSASKGIMLSLKRASTLSAFTRATYAKGTNIELVITKNNRVFLSMYGLNSPIEIDVNCIDRNFND